MKIKPANYYPFFFLGFLLIAACNNTSKTEVVGAVKEAIETGLPEVLSKTDSLGNKYTMSNYPYTVYRSSGGKTPIPGDQVSYHETIYQNDSIIYSTRLMQRPITSVLPPLDELPTPFPPDYEALLLMAVGDSLCVIQDLDTFDIKTLPQGVTNEDDFIYHIVLEEIVPKAEVEKRLAAMKAREQSVKDTVADLIQKYEDGSLASQLTTHESGLKYMLFEKGNGREAESGNFVRVHYSGFLKDKTNFDNTFTDAEPFTFRLDRGRVIPGWDIGVDLMAVGGKGIFFIPYGLAYGVAGKPPRIPEKADLVFYIEVVDVY